MTILCAMRGVVAVSVFSLVTGIASGQILHASGPTPSFEVATIKLWQPPPPPPVRADKPPIKFDPGGARPQTSDRVHRITPIFELIASAYNLPMGSDRVIGGAEWLNSTGQQYELQATIGEAEFAAMQKMPLPQQQERIKLMEQSLLADRFQLKVHFETREMQTFVLEVAKGGPKLTPAKEGEPVSLFSAPDPFNEMRASAVTMDRLAHSPLLLGGRTVIDQTGLTGTYDFVMKLGPDDSIFTALQEQLGLRLVAKKVPMEVIVIEHIERPSLN